MPRLHAKIIKLRPIVAETGPIGGTVDEAPQTIVITDSGDFPMKHQEFVDQIAAFDTCFKASEITGFTDAELYDHLIVALQDNAIIQDNDRYCSSQVAYEMKTKMQGYKYKSGLSPQTCEFTPVL